MATGLVGISLLVWRNTGRATCPYCAAIDGVVVGREQSFVPAGMDFNPAGSDGSMRIRGPKKHPPLHDKCDCILEISV